MINYTTNQRRSLKYDGSDWIEEVLNASGVAIDDSSWSAISGSTLDAALLSADNVLSGISVVPASGVVFIEDVSNVSGTLGGTLGDLDTIVLGSASDSVFKFSFGIPSQPVDPVHVRFIFSALASGTGNFGGVLDYNLFDDGDDLTPGSFAYQATATQSLVAGDSEKMKILNMTIPTANFSSGSAPFTVSCQFTRDTSVASNYTQDIAVAQIYADNIPGAATGNTAGYVGGNLEVTGDLTVQGLAVLEGGSVPASIADTGVSGSLVLDNDYIYVAVGTNTWKRTNISNF